MRAESVEAERRVLWLFLTASVHHLFILWACRLHLMLSSLDSRKEKKVWVRDGGLHYNFHPVGFLHFYPLISFSCWKL